jgi:hypothetical protein
MALLNFPDPTVTQIYTANGNTWDWNGTSWVSANNLNLSDQVSGVLGTVYGGTGKALSDMSVGSVIYADTSSSFAALAPGTNNYVLATQGSGSAPYWKIDDSGTGSVGSGITGGFAYYSGLNSITSGTAVSYIAASNRVVLTSQILSLPSSVIDSGVWAGTAISLSNGGTNGNRSGIAISYELAVYNAAGTAITQIDTTSAIGNSVLLQANQTVMPTWVGQSSLSVGSATTATNAGSAGTSVTAGSAGTAVNAGSAGSATTATSAGTAGTATNAGSAGTSVTAGSAGTAVNAGNAGSATTATSAGTAGTATNAGSAGSATTATNAGSAGSATTATSAGTAGTATNAGSAGSATTATNAGSAGTAVNAGSATTATNAGSAGSATTATSAGTAGTATNAGSAGTSVTAGSAGTAVNAGSATTATNAGSAGSATTATNAGSAGTSVTAGSAGTAVNAGSATTATNAGRAEAIRTQTFSGVNYLLVSSSDSAQSSQSLFVGTGISVTSTSFVVPENTILGALTNSTTSTSGALVVYGGAGITGNLNVGGNFVLTGDLTVNGTTTTVNSTVSTVVDPIITIGTGVGGTVPSSADSKDRGIAFYYFSGSGKTGFFGWDQSVSKYTLLTDATINSEVVSGTKATLVADLDGNAGSATTATSAGTAGTSTTAGSAGTSVTAGSATTATTSGSAGSATTATSAGTAGTSTTAGSAGTSVTAGTAGTATNAGSAGSATTATNAGSAGSATTATSAGTAGTANNAGSAGTSVTAGSAGTAVNAGSAGSATTATSAGTAGTATNAGSAGSATTATNAGTAGTATNAGSAGTSVTAGSAGTAVNAGSATTATNAGLAGLATSSVLVGIGTTIATAYLAAVLLNTATGGTQIYTGSGITIGNNRITATTFQGNHLGTWTGTAVTALYGGTGLASVNKLDVLTGASSGNSWIAIGSTFLPSAYIGEFAPAALTAFGATQPGQLWWDSTYGVLKVYYADTNTNQWVDALPVLGSNGGSAVKRSYLLSFGAGFTPSLGSDSVSVMIPYAPDNTSLFYYIKRLDYRNETVSSGAGVSFYIERNTTQNPATAWTTANTITSAAGSSFKAAGIYITSYTLAGSGASFVSSAGVAASVMSGDYLRLNFSALNSAATMSVSIIIEQQ